MPNGIMTDAIRIDWTTVINKLESAIHDSDFIKRPLRQQLLIMRSLLDIQSCYNSDNIEEFLIIIDKLKEENVL